jgi:hypothetical protein
MYYISYGLYGFSAAEIVPAITGLSSPTVILAGARVGEREPQLAPGQRRAGASFPSLYLT